MKNEAHFSSCQNSISMCEHFFFPSVQASHFIKSHVNDDVDSMAYQRSNATTEGATNWNIEINFIELHPIKSKSTIFIRLYSLAISMVLVIYVVIFPRWMNVASTMFLATFCSFGDLTFYVSGDGTGAGGAANDSYPEIIIICIAALKNMKMRTSFTSIVKVFNHDFASMVSILMLPNAEHVSMNDCQRLCVSVARQKAQRVISTEWHMYLYPLSVFMVSGTKPVES